MPSRAGSGISVLVIDVKPPRVWTPRHPSAYSAGNVSSETFPDFGNLGATIHRRSSTMTISSWTRRGRAGSAVAAVAALALGSAACGPGAQGASPARPEHGQLTGPLFTKQETQPVLAKSAHRPPT